MKDFYLNNLHKESDSSLIHGIGKFIRHHRLENNWTQQDLAYKSGINRTTLSDIELGRSCQLLSLIQVLRILNQLSFLEFFEIKQQISPIKLAEIEMKKRKKASRQKKIIP